MDFLDVYGIAAYMLIADGEGGAEVYSIASKRDQARILFDETYSMIQQSPNLSKHIKKRKVICIFRLLCLNSCHWQKTVIH